MKMRGAVGRAVACRDAALKAMGLIAVMAASLSSVSAGEAIAACPNEALRSGTSASLPDCRAYEQATPTEKLGNSANGGSGLVQASTDGNGITFMTLAGLPGSEGLQDFPSYLASRGEDWSTRNLLPPAANGAVGQVLGWSEDEAYSFMAARQGFGASFPFTLYMRENSTGSIRELATGAKNSIGYAGTASGASAVAFEVKTKLAGTEGIEAKPNVYLWDRSSNSVKLASVLNDGLSPTTEGALAGPYDWWSTGNTKVGGPLERYYAQAEHVLSRDSSNVFFTAANTGQVYVRQNPLAPQSALAGGIAIANGAATGTGAVTAGSNTVTELIAAKATTGKTTVGSPTVTGVKPTIGRYVVGQPINSVAGKIPAGTTVAGVVEVKANEFTLTLSQNAEATASNVSIVSPGPAPFVVGQRVSGVGIPFGTTITAASAGSLTLSANASESVAVDALTASTECTEASKGCTLQVSDSERTTPDLNGPKPAAFIGATADGSAAFFMSSSALTDDAHTGSADAGNDLYRYRPHASVGHRLTDLSLDSTDPNGAGVKGVLGVSADGSYVYFAAAGQLDGTTAPSSTCTGSGETTTGTCNVYLWHEDSSTHVQKATFVAQLEAGGGIAAMRDRFNWSPRARNSTGTEALPIARVADDGALLFASTLALTGYDNVGPNCDPITGEDGPCPELYRYLPAAGHPACISCNPSEAPPVGKGTQLVSIGAASQPTGPAGVLTRNMTADGDRIFFESPEKLVPGDINGDNGCPLVKVPGGNFSVPRCQDVYEWEANGTGSCHSESANGGCLFLISSGTSPEPSLFADNDSSGDNAFFFTYDSLVSQDTDQLVDIYDARSGGGIASQNTPRPSICRGEGCKGPPAPVPGTTIAGSTTFSGPGNQQPPKHRKKKHHKPKKHKSHGKSKHKQQGKGHR